MEQVKEFRIAEGNVRFEQILATTENGEEKKKKNG